MIPKSLKNFLWAATQGDVDAQYGLGLIYAEGRGVEQDEAKSFYWLTRAIEQGDSGAVVLRKVVAAGMSAEQLTRARALMQDARAVQGQARGKTCRRRKRKQHPADFH